MSLILAVAEQMRLKSRLYLPCQEQWMGLVSDVQYHADCFVKTGVFIGATFSARSRECLKAELELNTKYCVYNWSSCDGCELGSGVRLGTACILLCTICCHEYSCLLEA